MTFRSTTIGACCKYEKVYTADIASLMWSTRNQAHIVHLCLLCLQVLQDLNALAVTVFACRWQHCHTFINCNWYYIAFQSDDTDSTITSLTSVKKHNLPYLWYNCPKWWVCHLERHWPRAYKNENCYINTTTTTGIVTLNTFLSWTK